MLVTWSQWSHRSTMGPTTACCLAFTSSFSFSFAVCMVVLLNSDACGCWALLAVVSTAGSEHCQLASCPKITWPPPHGFPVWGWCLWGTQWEGGVFEVKTCETSASLVLSELEREVMHYQRGLRAAAWHSPGVSGAGRTWRWKEGGAGVKLVQDRVQ